MMKEERRLVWRVLRYWKEMAQGGRFPCRDEIEPWVQGDDGANLLLIAVQSPIELSHFVAVGVNLAVALCPTHTLAGVLLSRLPRVVSARRGLMTEGAATLRSVGIAYRSVLLPLSERGLVIDHVLGATNYRLLRADEVETTEVIFPIHWLQFERAFSRFVRRHHLSGDIRDLMIQSVEARFGLVNRLPAPVEWLSDNGSPYIARETRALAREIGLVPLTTPIESPQSNGMAEAFVKTLQRDYAQVSRCPDAATVLRQLDGWFEHCDPASSHPSRYAIEGKRFC